MKSLLYVIVTTALISVTPFLAAFDPECIPTRGIMIFSIFAILLSFTIAKEKLSQKNGLIAIYATTYVAVALISLYDTFTIIKLMNLNPYVYGVIPFITTAFALLILKGVKSIPLKVINLSLFSALFLHLVVFNITGGQSLLTFTLIELF